MQINKIRDDFPILKNVAYMDNAATSLSPKSVVEAMNEFEYLYRANVGRALHRLAKFTSQRYFSAHEKIAQFIGGENGNVVLTKNTTESINTVACGLEWKNEDQIITTCLEHHSNFLPWVKLEKNGVNVTAIRPNLNGELDLSELESSINENTKLVAVTHVSNVLGNILPIKDIATLCKEKNVKLLIDGAQSVPHLLTNLKCIDCDYLCFSGHKMLGPTGTGILWMRNDDIKPLMVGGGMIDKVSVDDYTYAKGFNKYEAGTANISGAIGLSKAVEYLQNIGMDRIEKYENQLTQQLIQGLMDIEHVNIYGPLKNRIGVVSFNIEQMHSHEVAHILDEAANIMVRSGDHCCQPLMQHLGLDQGTVRVSLYIYNTQEEIELLLATVEEITRRL